MWFMAPNYQPGDYRHSGCSGCHVIYANDREPRHSLTYAKFGRDGETATVDPTIAGKLAASGDDHDGAPADGHDAGGGHGSLIDPTRSHAPDNPRRKEAGHPISHARSEEHTSELQSLMRISYAVFCLKKKNNNQQNTP